MELAVSQSTAINRRRFLGVSVATASTSLLARKAEAQPTGASDSPFGDLVRASLTINDKVHDVTIDPRTTLLDLLREKHGLTGAKKGCDHGQCGACTVLLGDRRVLSCLTLAAGVRDRVTTIEGVASAAPFQSSSMVKPYFESDHCIGGGSHQADDVGLTQSQAPGGASSLGGRCPRSSVWPPAAGASSSRCAYSSSQMSTRAVPWKWLGDMVQPLIFL
jgi:xanthine dehydrogenase YagT iron-sulfur-binding subunit